MKKLWKPFKSCLLNNIANPDQFGWKWAGLAVLFSRQLPNTSHDLFHITYQHLIKNPKSTISLTLPSYILGYQSNTGVY